MAALSEQRLNFIEVSQQQHRGKVLPEVMMLSQENELLMDIPWVQCNDGETHKFGQVVALPTVEKTAHNEGTTPSKARRAQQREHCSMLTGFSQVAETVARSGGHMAAMRAREDMTFTEAMRQAFAAMVMYGNRQVNNRDFDGFATRLNTLTGTKAKQVFGGGGTGNGTLTSMFAVNWGADVYMVYPEGTTGGLRKQDLGTQVITQDGKRLIVKETYHEWNFGLVVEDWRSFCRAPNIKVSDLIALTNNQAPANVNNILHAVVWMKSRLRKPGRKVIYAPDVVHTALMRIALEKSSSAVTLEKALTQFGDPHGEMQELKVLGTPVRLVQQILQTEDQVS